MARPKNEALINQPGWCANGKRYTPESSSVLEMKARTPEGKLRYWRHYSVYSKYESNLNTSIYFQVESEKSKRRYNVDISNQCINIRMHPAKEICPIAPRRDRTYFGVTIDNETHPLFPEFDLNPQGPQ